ncbi:EAL domain-containing protein [Leeia oryzae]|uniref:EAL domain-containing protein n=1 Tax=Leeia oryzae TaxID=356662 RepID=UPI0003735364|nr:EAL domain-containing protein [Leeia oryzae]
MKTGPSSLARQVLSVVLAFASSALFAQLGMLTTPFFGVHTSLNLIPGLAFVLMWRLGMLAWPFVLLGCWLALPPLTLAGLGYALISTLPSALTVFVLRHKDFDASLRRSKDFVLLLCWPVLFAALASISRLLLIPGFSLFKPDEAYVWQLVEVCVAHTLGTLLVTVPLLMFSVKRLKRTLQTPEFWIISFVCSLFIVNPGGKVSAEAQNPAIYLFIPVMVWSALRLRRFAHSLIMLQLAIAIFSLPGTVTVAVSPLTGHLLPLQIFLLVGALIGLFLSARQGERRYQQNLLVQRSEIYRWLAGVKHQITVSDNIPDLLQRLCEDVKIISAASNTGVIKETNHGYEWLYYYDFSQPEAPTPSLRNQEQACRSAVSLHRWHDRPYSVLSIPLKENCKGDLCILITFSNVNLINEDMLSFFDDQRQLLQTELEKRQLDAERQRLGVALRDAEAMWRYAMESSGEGIWDWHITAGIEYYSPRCQELMGLKEASSHDPLNTWQKCLHPEDQERWQTSLQQHVDGKSDRYQSEFRIQDGNGKVRWVFSRGKIISWDEQGQPLRMIGSVLDVSSLRQADEERLLAAQVFEASHEGILIIDAEKKILSANRAFMHMTGYDQAHLLQKPALFFSAPPSIQDTQHVWEQLDTSLHWQGDWVGVRQNGSTFPMWLSVSCVPGTDESTASQYVMLASDMTQRKADSDRIQYLAHHDLLTGLPNRALLNDRLEQLLLAADRTQSQFACIFIDLDHFKHINDSLGHAIGDLLLQEVARCLLASVRKGDTVSRLGGDEFILLLPNAGANESDKVAQHLLTSLSSPFTIHGHTLHITPSIGISLFPGDGHSAEELIKHADIAMYHAKQLGRNNVQLFQQNLLEASRERMVIESGLRSALKNQRLSLNYQPQYNVASGEIEGMEALLRWRDPHLGQVSPGQFIPIAEESHLILDLGNFVLNESCRQLASWIKQGLTPPTLAINVSLRQLMQEGFAEQVLSTLAHHRIPPRLLEVELTETMLMHDPQHAQHVLETLTNAGVSVAIDDFGTGYSSLSYLKRLSVTRIKIDQSFVKDLTKDSDDEAIVRAILGLAQNLKMAVTAEGVETAQQLAFLKEAGCDSFQGYYYAPPLPADTLQEMLYDRVNEPAFLN